MSPIPSPLQAWIKITFQLILPSWIQSPSRIQCSAQSCLYILDTCLVSIGSQTSVGPKVSFYSATHPLDPQLRNGTQGPEASKEIHVSDDCWTGSVAIVLPGMRISAIKAGSLATTAFPCGGPWLAILPRSFAN